LYVVLKYAVVVFVGSGPAYFFYLLEALEEAGVKLGMPRDVARGLAAQTCIGAGMVFLFLLLTSFKSYTLAITTSQASHLV
jgi:hypothetical protein